MGPSRVALVTGASAGIGAAICEVLVKKGINVIGAARRLEKLQVLASSLKNEKGTLTPFMCDITDDKQVQNLFDSIKDKYGGIDVCVNNAGMISNKTLIDDTPSSWRQILDLNVVALCLCSQFAVKSIEEKKVDNGYIINIGSLSGHVVHDIDTHHFYEATKFAVRALTEGLRQEMKQRKNNIRVSLISPGMVTSDILDVLPSNSQLHQLEEHTNPLSGEDIGVIVHQLLSFPPRVEVNDIIVTPSVSAM